MLWFIVVSMTLAELRARRDARVREAKERQSTGGPPQTPEQPMVRVTELQTPTQPTTAPQAPTNDDETASTAAATTAPAAATTSAAAAEQSGKDSSTVAAYKETLAALREQAAALGINPADVNSGGRGRGRGRGGVVSGYAPRGARGTVRGRDADAAVLVLVRAAARQSVCHAASGGRTDGLARPGACGSLPRTSLCSLPGLFSCVSVAVWR